MNQDSIIYFENVSKWFGDFQVLNKINLEVNKGEKIVVCGPSGSGKSTMIRCINRLEEHQEGKIIVDGTELTGNIKNIDTVRKEVAKMSKGEVNNSMIKLLTKKHILQYNICDTVFDFVFPIGIGYGKTLWVDSDILIGNDTTALRDRIDLPYRTIGAAITDAVAGDTVHIRTGSYTQDITLKNLVNIYCDEGVVINGKITDGGNPAVSVVSGNGILQDTATTNQCIEITGNGSDVNINLNIVNVNVYATW